MRAAALAALLLCATPAAAQPAFEERLVLSAPRYDAPAASEFSAVARPNTGFQTRIVRALIRDHLRDYRVRVLQDGFAVQKRFTIGK